MTKKGEAKSSRCKLWRTIPSAPHDYAMLEGLHAVAVVGLAFAFGTSLPDPPIDVTPAPEQAATPAQPVALGSWYCWQGLLIDGTGALVLVAACRPNCRSTPPASQPTALRLFVDAHQLLIAARF